jgi:hypothetical protein
MDDYRQDSACTGISGAPPAGFKTLTSEETSTYRSWRRAVLAFYCLLLVSGFALLASAPVPHQEVAQVQGMPPVNVP